MAGRGTQAVVVIDNGGGVCKVGYAGQPDPLKVFPNCTAKAKGAHSTYVGDKLLECKTIVGLTFRRPVDRGYVVDWDLQKLIWNRVFNSALQVPIGDSGLLLTEPLFNLPQIRDNTDQVVFEEYGFASFLPMPSAPLSLRYASSQAPDTPGAQAQTGIVIDAGFSFTHAVPVYDGRVLPSGVRRVNLGGKAMTNHMKTTITYRSLDLRDEAYVVDFMKEAVCFVSQDPRADLLRSRKMRSSPFVCEYVLPDGVNNLRGHMREVQPAKKPSQDAQAATEQVLKLNNERFMVPEMIFRPSDIGLDQAGIPEATGQALAATPLAVQGLLAGNVLLTGGITQCPGFVERFETELRPHVPDLYDVSVSQPPRPEMAAWRGASMLGSSPQEYAALATTKAEYEETGRVRRYA